MQQIGGNASIIESRSRLMRILWIAFLMSIVFLFVLTLILPSPQNPQSDMTVLTWAILAIGTTAAIISIVPKRIMLNQAIEKQSTSIVFTAHIVAFGLSESAAVFGLLLHFVAPGRAYIYLFMVSAAAMLAHYPRREHLLAASYKNGLMEDRN